MRIIDDLADLVVGATVIASVTFALYVTRPAAPPPLAAATRFVAECPTAQYEIWHVGPQRSMLIICEGNTR